jgi:hypothetical protein
VESSARGDAVVHCPRLGRPRLAAEHLACPYCFGKKAEVRKGDRADFCDFKPGVDAVSYGDPSVLRRYQ